MSQLEGVPISAGFAAGTAIVYGYDIERRLEIPRRELLSSEIATEHDRLDQAVEQSHGELQESQNRAVVAPDKFDIDTLLAVQARIVNEVATIVKRRVSEEFVNVEHALDAVIDEFVQRLSQLESDYFRDRQQDLRDVGHRMMRHLTGTLPASHTRLPASSVVVAAELLPSEAIELAQSGLAAIVVERGGKYSHTAILARSLRIPAVAGIAEVTSRIPPGEHVLVDGETGRVTIAPSQSEIANFASRKRDFEEPISVAVDSQVCLTADGVEVTLLANIGRPEDVDQVLARSLAGVGLFRTEFIYLESRQRPDFKDQVDIYRRAAAMLGERPLIIRTFDLGGDKLPPFLSIGRSPSSAHPHLRGLSFSLAEKRLFETQVRAVVQVAQERNVRILLPMVVDSHDLARAIATIERVIKQLGAKPGLLIGAMIETPAALFVLDEILDLADFVSIGTNDLMHFMLAVDRDLTAGSDEYTSLRPAILRAIRHTVDAASARSCPVCVCGEEAGDVDFACLLIGLGIRELSLSPARAQAVRQAIREINTQHAREIANEALRCRSPGEVRELLAKLRLGRAADGPDAHRAR